MEETPMSSFQDEVAKIQKEGRDRWNSAISNVTKHRVDKIVRDWKRRIPSLAAVVHALRYQKSGIYVIDKVVSMETDYDIAAVIARLPEPTATQIYERLKTLTKKLGLTAQEQAMLC